MKRQARSRSLPSYSPSLNASADTILNFVKLCQGNQTLEKSLDALSDFVGADAICLSRRNRNRRNLRTVMIRDTNADLRTPRLERPFALEILGHHVDSMKAGVVLNLSQVRDEPAALDLLLTDWIERRRIEEIGILCLASENGLRDMIEVHFGRTPSKVWADQANEIAFLLSEIFAGRKPGLIDNMIFGKQTGGHHKVAELILAPENPSSLTRSEWRLCFLISKGLSKSGIANEMQITENTLRTHLRNVYAKTGHNSFHSLARQLVGADEQQMLAAALRREAA
ncbi:MAG: helix-turn-helix transcriptional regulator [Pseudomonadota bacterium]